MAGRGSVATLPLITNRSMPSFANIYIVFMDKMTEDGAFSRSSHGLCVESGDGEAG